MDKRGELLLRVLPRPLAAELRRMFTGNPGLFSRVGELRLRAGRAASLSLDGREVLLPVTVSEEEFGRCFAALCGPSPYVQEHALCEGYLSYEGMRVGVAGQAVLQGNTVVGLATPTSLCIRIPHRVRGAGSEAYRLFLSLGGRRGMLIYSPPGGGKTTLLADLALSLATDGGYAVALVDTRGELYDPETPPLARIDRLLGYPIAQGILQATRTLSPDVIICDEIGTAAEAEAILSVAGAGVPIIASTHAGQPRELVSRPPIARLLEAGIFSALVGIVREGDRYTYRTSEMGGEGAECSMALASFS